jgi:hypothetical protein
MGKSVNASKKWCPAFGMKAGQIYKKIQYKHSAQRYRG